MNKRSITEKLYIALFCLIASASLLLLCSQCSPLYPINVWGDANCLLTVGRVMKEGGVVYRDIYEQKGPTLYLIHTAAAWISDTSFFGVYVLEVLSLTAVLFGACLIGTRRRGIWAVCCDAALIAACMLVGSAFSRGDSAEEFCLPYLMGTLLLAFRHYGEKDGPMQSKALFLCGLFAGTVAMIKFTILGLFVGLCLVEGIVALQAGGVKRALQSAGVFLAGMLLPIAAWCVYFACHGALGDFYTAYIHNNIFLYSDEMRTQIDVVRDIWNTVKGNALWVLLACVSMLAFLLDRREKLQLRLAILSMAVGAFVCVFLLGRTWPYSPLVLSVFAFVGFTSAANRADRIKSRWIRFTAAGVSCLLAFAVALWLSPNAYLRGVKLDDLAQGRLAKYLHEDATLLQYNHLDDGLYLAANRLPQQKYFVRLNVQYDEMDKELDRALLEAIPDYVLTSWEPLPEEFDRYQLIATDAGYDDEDRINKLLYLYRRK